MGKEGKNKKQTLEDAHIDIRAILDTLGTPIVYCDAALYLVDAPVLKEILEVDKYLVPIRTDSIRGSAYDIKKIVNIINPDTLAYSYKLVTAYKYPYVSTKDKCIDLIPAERDKSAHFYRKQLADSIEEKEKKGIPISEEKRKELELPVELQIEKEKSYLQKVIDNQEKYDVKISGYDERIAYGQINFKYITFDKKKKKNVHKSTNKHLSIKYPNIFLYEPLDMPSENRVDMEVKYLIGKGFKKIGRRIFIREKGFDDGKI